MELSLPAEQNSRPAPYPVRFQESSPNQASWSFFLNQAVSEMNGGDGNGGAYQPVVIAPVGTLAE